MRISDWSSDVCSSDLGRDAIFGGLRNPDPAAHGDAVHEGGDGLWISEEQMVEAIFGVEEEARFLAVLRAAFREHADVARSEEHTSELQSLMRISYAVCCLKKEQKQNTSHNKN